MSHGGDLMKSSVFTLPANPIRTSVAGAPRHPGDLVTVICSTDPAGGGTDVLDYVGLRGKVEYREYECGSGQSFPGDPMIGVRFSDGRLEEFWREELA